MKLISERPGVLGAKLDTYLSHDEAFAAAFAYTKRRFESAEQLTAHNWAHCYRDTLNAIVIGEAEGADMSIVLPAITMHDIGFLYGAIGKTHAAVGADHLATYLEEAGISYPASIVDQIADCIRTHKGSLHRQKPESLEAKVVADADLLEKFGPFGIYQNLRSFTEFNYSLEKILGRRAEIETATLETATGRRLAEPGRQFVIAFYEELAEANKPYELAD